MTTSEAYVLIRKTPDPCQDGNSMSRPKLLCSKVQTVFEPDAAGVTEVLYLSEDNEPMTAYFRGKVFLYHAEGW